MLPTIFYRAQPRIRIIRGWAPGDGNGLTLTMPCIVRPVGDALAIKSGQIIKPGAGIWNIGGSAGQAPYFAFQDQHDPDVVSVADQRAPGGYLMGFSTLGDFVLETPYFDQAGVYPIGAKVYAAGLGNIGGLTTTVTDEPVGFVEAGPNPLVKYTNEQQIVQIYSFTPGTVGSAGVPEGNDSVTAFSRNSEAVYGANTGTPLAPSMTTRVLRIRTRWN